jgi:hypothetical protein
VKKLELGFCPFTMKVMSGRMIINLKRYFLQKQQTGCFPLGSGIFWIHNKLLPLYHKIFTEYFAQYVEFGTLTSEGPSNSNTRLQGNFFTLLGHFFTIPALFRGLKTIWPAVEPTGTSSNVSQSLNPT